MSMTVIRELALIPCRIPKACREIEYSVVAHLFAQVGRVHRDAGRDHEINRFGEFLYASIDRVGNTRGKVDDSLQQRAVGALKVHYRHLPRTQRVSDFG